MDEAKRRGSGELTVVRLDSSRRRFSRVAPLTDGEIERMRSMLEQFDRLATSCPIARRTLFGAS